MFLRVMLQARFGVEQRIRRVIELLDVLRDHEIDRFFQTVANVEGSHEGFERIGQHRGIVLAAGCAHSRAETHQLAEREPPCRSRELRVVDDRRLDVLEDLLVDALRVVLGPKQEGGGSRRAARRAPPAA